MEQTEYLKSWIREVVKSGGFMLIDVAVKVLDIEEGVDQAQEDNLGNNKAADKVLYDEQEDA